MGFRFWKRVKVAKGVSLNLSKSGGSVSFGPRGAKLTVGSRGKRATVGIPGSGIFYTVTSQANCRAARKACLLLLQMLQRLAPGSPSLGFFRRLIA